MFGGIDARLLALPVAAALALGAVGCGGDEETGEARQAPPQYSEGSEPAKAFAERMAKLLETTTVAKDCAQIEQINARSFSRFPCPPDKSLRKSMASFKIVGAKEYGTGAIVDYESSAEKDGAAMVLFVAPDRNWGIGRFGVLTKPSTSSSDAETREGFDKAVDTYLEAIRGRDCAAYFGVVFANGASEKEVCKTLFPQTKRHAKWLKANPSSKPVYEGGNGTYGFFTFETQKPKPANSTISVVRESENSDKYEVLDLAPSPTAAEQRKVRKDYERQQREKRKNGGSSMEPSSKPSDPAVTTP
jgi:hypothetical protein